MKKANKSDTRSDQQRRTAQAARTKRRATKRKAAALAAAYKLVKQNNKLFETNMRLNQELEALRPVIQQEAENAGGQE